VRDIEPGKLYTPTCDLVVVLFNDEDKIIERFSLSPGQVLLALSRPFNRKHVYTNHDPHHFDSQTMKWEVRQVWSCKFLAGKKMVELSFDVYEHRKCTYVEYMQLIRIWISSLEKTSV